MLTAICLKSIWKVQTLRFTFRHAYLRKMIADNACYGALSYIIVDSSSWISRHCDLHVLIFTTALSVFMIIVKFLPGVALGRRFCFLSGLYVNVKIVARETSAMV